VVVFKGELTIMIINWKDRALGKGEGGSGEEEADWRRK